MDDGTSRDAFGEATARIVAGTVLELLTRGHVTRANAQAMFERGAELLRAHSEVRSLVFETSEHEGHDPGNLAFGIRWLREHGGQLMRAAVVTRSHAFGALIQVGRVMVPRLEARAFSSREDAIQWCIATVASSTSSRRRGGRSRRADA